ncbi:MAG: hypothetical protein R6U02_02480 [Alkalibacterium sp.]|uniref:hypothetical protein n=1 Tax=Alkalibacterium sp. TaxID=1872447 RepID=UPI003970C858
MNRDELLKDWYVRYNFILGARRTAKQKERFLKSMLYDLNVMDRKAKLHEFGSNNQGKNIYIGNIKNAKKVICTYYDTPIFQHDSYHLADYELNKKNTLKTMVLHSTIFLIIGLAFTFLIGIPIYQANELLSLPSILVSLFLMIYFIILKKISTGLSSKLNLVRNTSSLLLMLQFMSKHRDKDTAFAFLDAGTYNHAGLNELRENCRGKIYLLDSVGADKPLYQISDNERMFVAESRVEQVKQNLFDHSDILILTSMEKINQSFQLDKRSLKKKNVDEHNMNATFDFLEKLVGRKT